MKHRTLQNVARFLADHPRWLFGAAIVYFISPVDLVPEMFVGPVGYLDDLLVMLLPYVIIEYARRHRRLPPDVLDTTAVEGRR